MNYAYTEDVLERESDFIDAIALVREIAHHEPNRVREWDGEDLADDNKMGWVPVFVEPGAMFQGTMADEDGRVPGDWQQVDHLWDYVRISYKPPEAATTVRFTYEIREVDAPSGDRKRMRVLSIQMDMVTSTAKGAGLMPSEVYANKAHFFSLAEPLVRRFMPFHTQVGASIHASEPVPRSFPSSGTVHLRTPVMMRFSADDTDVHNTVGAKAPVAILGPDGRPAS